MTARMTGGWRDWISPCCGCSWALNEQTGVHFCLGCGEPDASSGTSTELEAKMHSEALEATEAVSAKNATAPRVSLDDMKAKIAREHYFNVGQLLRASGQPVEECGRDPLDILTVCILVMQNGFTVIGKSAPASPENFDPSKGQQFAFEDAIKQLWPLEGYALREKLAA